MDSPSRSMAWRCQDQSAMTYSPSGRRRETASRRTPGSGPEVRCIVHDQVERSRAERRTEDPCNFVSVRLTDAVLSTAALVQSPPCEIALQGGNWRWVVLDGNQHLRLCELHEQSVLPPRKTPSSTMCSGRRERMTSTYRSMLCRAFNNTKRSGGDSRPAIASKERANEPSSPSVTNLMPRPVTEHCSSIHASTANHTTDHLIPRRRSGSHPPVAFARHRPEVKG
jgi:hypothetical protein